MALKALILKRKIDDATVRLTALREKDNSFTTREAELTAAVEEITDETSEEDRQSVEAAVDEFDEQQNAHEEEKKSLEKTIDELSAQLAEEERASAAAAAEIEDEPAPQEEERTHERHMKTREFFGMNMQERDRFFADENVKEFISQVRTCIKEKRALTNVGLTIPNTIFPLIKEQVASSSKLLQYVTAKYVRGTARQNIMGTVPEAVWTEMTGKINELSLSFNNVELDGFKVGGIIYVNNSTLEDSDVDLMSEIILALGIAIGKALDKSIVFGTGVKMPLGFLTRLAQTVAPEGYSATARPWADLHTSNITKITGKTGNALFQSLVLATQAIDNDYAMGEIVWIMNKKTKAKITSESMGANANATIVAGMQNTMPVVGGPIVDISAMADNDIAFAYLDLYTLLVRKDVNLAYSSEYKFADDQTAFKGTMRADGIPVIAEAFGIININNVAPTTTASFTADTANV